FPNRHAKFWNIVAFPMAPVGFAQTCQHRVAFVLDPDHQVVFFCLIVRAFKPARRPWRAGRQSTSLMRPVMSRSETARTDSRALSNTRCPPARNHSAWMRRDTHPPPANSDSGRVAGAGKEPRRFRPTYRTT